MLLRSQQVNVASLEVVIRHFLSKAEQALTDAEADARKVTNFTDGEIEDEVSPEALLLDIVQSKDARNLSAAEIVSPWTKFLWESYKTALNILRNNAKLEGLYQYSISPPPIHRRAYAVRAFAYCQEHHRVAEFKRLCDILRNHLTNLGKFSHQNQNVSLTNPETLQMMIETRFAQLEAASNLQLWQVSPPFFFSDHFSNIRAPSLESHPLQY